MAQFGCTAMCEQPPVTQLVSDLLAAEDAGFDFLVISDHYFPWLQGHDLPDTPVPVDIAVSGPESDRRPRRQPGPARRAGPPGRQARPVPAAA